MQEVGTKYTLDISELIEKLEKGGKLFADFDDKVNKASQRNPIATFTKSQEGFNRALGQQVQEYQRVQAATAAVRAEQKKLEAQLVDLKKRQKELVTADEYDKLKKKIEELEKKIELLNKELGKTPGHSDKAKTSVEKLGSAIKTAFTVTGVLFLLEKLFEIGKKIVDITGESEKFQNQFTRIFEGNGEAAKGYLSVLQKTADTTNFTFDELAENAAKLASRGIIPTQKELLKLGDTANFINQPFEKLNEAILDGSNAERWQDLGFVVKTQGDKMTLSYGEFSKTVDKSTAGAYSAIQAFAAQGKVLGSTAEAGKTLSGRVSTIMDNFAGLFRTIGQGNTGPLNDFLDLVSDILIGAKEVIKQLQPSFEGVGRAIVGVAKSIGGVLGSLSAFSDATDTSATASQKFGFYLNKYIITPLTFFTTITASAVEGLNLIVLRAEQAAAQLTGKSSIANALGGQIKETKARLKELQTDAQRLFNLPEQKLADYVKSDNLRKKREEAKDKADAEALANFKLKPGQKKPQTATAAEIKAKADEYNLLLKGREDYQKALKDLEEKYGKEQLEALDKNSVAYIEKKAQLDRDEIEAERKHMLELYRIQSAKTVFRNPLTKKLEPVIDKTLQLPEKTQSIFANRTATVDAEEAKKLEELRYQNSLKLLQITRQFDTLEVEEVKHKWDEIIKAELNGFKGTAEQRVKFEADLRAKQKSEIERVKIGQAINQNNDQTDASLSFVDTDRFKAILLAEKANALGIVNIEAEKEKKRLDIRIESGNKLIAYLKAQGEKENAVLIASTQASVDALTKQRDDFTSLDFSSGAGFFGSLLGLGGAELDNFKKGIDAVSSSITQVTQLAIQESEQKIAALEAQISAKQEQVNEEEKRNAEGYANNLSIRQAELADLKRQKADEENERRKALKIQQELDLASNISSNAAAATQLVLLTIKAFTAYAGFPFVGIALALGTIATIYAGIRTAKAQAKAIQQLRGGGRLNQTDAKTHERGGHKIEGTNIEVEKDEWVVNSKSSEKFNNTIDALNRNSSHEALKALMKEGGIGLPAIIIQHMQQPGFGTAKGGQDMAKLVNTLNEHGELLKVLVKHTKPGKSYVAKGPNGYLEIDGNKTIHHQ